MSSNIEETIISMVQKLPPAQQREVLAFAESLQRGGRHETSVSSSPARVSVWDKVAERIRQVPDEALQEVPADASENLDHYLYGAPRR